MISVALAAYKGERYIAEQLDSILSQLGPADEVVVSDDLPGGETEQIVRGIAKTDPRVRYVEGPGQGVIRNFNFAIGETRGGPDLPRRPGRYLAAGQGETLHGCHG